MATAAEARLDGGGSRRTVRAGGAAGAATCPGVVPWVGREERGDLVRLDDDGDTECLDTYADVARDDCDPRGRR